MNTCLYAESLTSEGLRFYMMIVDETHMSEGLRFYMMIVDDNMTMMAPITHTRALNSV